MFKALLKKQISELLGVYMNKGQKNRKGSNFGGKGLIVLYVFLYIFMAGVFGMLGYAFGEMLIGTEMEWGYFAIAGMVAFMLSVFGSAFTTYSGLYRAKDNETLLAMPIPPGMILVTRMLSVYGSAILYSSVVMLPAYVVYAIMSSAPLVPLLLMIPMMLLESLVALAVICILGWIIALVADMLHGRSIVTVIIAIVAMAAYYMAIGNLSEVFQSAVMNAGNIVETLKTNAWPLYAFGMGAYGSLVYVLLFVLFTAVVAGVVYFALSKTYMRIATANHSGKKAVYKAEKSVSSTPRKALLKRELNHYVSSANYMLNCSMGTILSIALIGLVIIKMGDMNELIGALNVLKAAYPGAETVICAGSILVACMLSNCNIISAPSISIEGKCITILRTMPVSAGDVFRAKQEAHILLTLPVVLPAGVLVSIFLGLPILHTALTVVTAILYTMLIAALGLLLNMWKPNLDWVNETVAVKQGAPIVITMFGGWAALIALGALIWFTKTLPWWAPIAAMDVLFAGAWLLIQKALAGYGARRFEEL